MRDLNSWTALACLLFSVACGREQPPERPPPQTGEARRDAGVAQEKRRKPKRGAAPDAPRMNGYALEDFGDFTREWAFVTVRYRMDSGEQRITYANDLAMAVLKAGSLTRGAGLADACTRCGWSAEPLRELDLIDI